MTKISPHHHDITPSSSRCITILMALSRTFHKTSNFHDNILVHQGAIAHQHRVQCPWPDKSACCFLYSFSQICSVVSYKVSLPVNKWFATIIKFRLVRSSSNRTNSEYLRCKSLTEVCLIRSSLAWKCRRKVRIPSMFRASLRMQADLRWLCLYGSSLNFNKSFEKGNY